MLSSDKEQSGLCEKTLWQRIWIVIPFAVLCGVLLAFSRMFMWSAGLLCVAGLGGLWLWMAQSNMRGCVRVGMWMGLAYALVNLLALRLSVVLLLGFVIGYLLLGVIIGLVVGMTRKGAPAYRVIAWIAIVMLLDGLQVALGPFGDSQVLAVPLSQWEVTSPLLRLAGPWTLTLVWGLCLGAIWLIWRDKIAALIFIFAVLFLWGMGLYLRPKITDETLCVAAIGLPQGQAYLSGEDECAVLQPLLEKAAAQQASLIVAPELMLSVDGINDPLLNQWDQWAKQNELLMVVGVYNWQTQTNDAILLGAKQRLLIRKCHLVPGFESYAAVGEPDQELLQNQPYALGAMICQDDNFADTVHGRRSAQVMAVPTLDWPAVTWAHWMGSRGRAAEQGQVVVRSAIGGISAIIDSHGTVIAQHNSVTRGPGIIIAQVNLPQPVKWSSYWGRWLLWLDASFGLVLSVVIIRRS